MSVPRWMCHRAFRAITVLSLSRVDKVSLIDEDSESGILIPIFWAFIALPQNLLRWLRSRLTMTLLTNTA